MYKLMIVSAVLALAAAKPDIVAPLSYTANTVAVHEPVPVAHALPVAAQAVPVAPTWRYAAAPAIATPTIAASVIATPVIATPTVRVAAPALNIGGPAITAPLAYPAPPFSSPVWSAYAAAVAPLPYGYNYGVNYPSYYWKKR